LITREAKRSPTRTSSEFSSDSPPLKAGSTGDTAGSVPAAASVKNWEMGTSLSPFSEAKLKRIASDGRSE